MGDMTFLASLTDMLDAILAPSIEKAQSNVGRFLRSAATTFIKPNLLTQLGKNVMDWQNKTMKDRKGLGAELFKYTPVVREDIMICLTV